MHMRKGLVGTVAGGLVAAVAIAVPALAEGSDDEGARQHPDMGRMHEQMVDNPGMARMHEEMSDNPGMARMHEQMMSGVESSDQS